MNLLNDIKKKIHRDQGFTITEVLAATIILGLSMTIVTTAIILAYNRFFRQVEASQAQELCAALCTSIQDELTYASDVKYGSGDEVLSFYSDRLNGNVNFYLGNDSDDSAGSDELLTVNTATATKDDASRVLLAMVDTSGGAAVVDEESVYGLVSAGAYELDTGGDLGLRASMSLKGDASDESFLVKVNVYGVKNDALLSTKTFRVGQFNKSTDSVSTVDPSLVTLSYTLNFDGDGHGTPSVSTIDNLSAGDTIGFEGTKGNWPTVTNVEDGYTFTGWSDGTNTYGSTSTYTVNGGAIFTAVYAVNKYTVTFHGNGGKIDDGSANGVDNYDISSVNQGSTVTLPNVSRKGYTFVGWNTAADASGSAFTAGTSVNANTEVYAIWTPNTYQATFAINGGTFQNDYGNATSNQTVDVEYGTNLTMPQAPTKEHATFKGWSYSLDGGLNSVVLSAGATIVYTFDENVTFTAKWEPQCEVTFRLDGGTISGGTPSTLWVDKGTTITLPTATKDGASFSGWTIGNDTTTYRQAGYSYTVNSDVEITAHWNSYRINLYNGTTPVGALYCGADGTQATFLADSAYKGTSFTEIASNIFHSDESSAQIAAGNHENWRLSGWYYIDNSGQTQIFTVSGDEDTTTTTLTSAGRTKMTELLASNNTVKLYAGWSNKKQLYHKTDRLVDNKQFLIIGGDNIGTNQKALTNNGNSSVTTANVTVRGDSLTKYVLYANVSAYEWSASNGSNSRFYIKKNALNNRYLDINTIGTDELQLKNNTNCRQWTYDDSNNELTGHWGLNNRYVNYSNNSFNVTSSSSDSADIHIYELKNANTVVSFNGYN